MSVALYPNRSSSRSSWTRRSRTSSATRCSFVSPLTFQPSGWRCTTASNSNASTLTMTEHSNAAAV